MIVSDNNPVFFFFNDTATTEIYTLSLHDALPICAGSAFSSAAVMPAAKSKRRMTSPLETSSTNRRSEEHTSELQSPCNLVCRLLLEKKKDQTKLLANNTDHMQTDLHIYSSQRRLH